MELMFGILWFLLTLCISTCDKDSWNHTLFNPETIIPSKGLKYINIPIIPENVVQDNKLANIAPYPLSRSLNLLHEAKDIQGRDVIIGLASYKSFPRGFARLVGSLRRNGYDGHIILGIHPYLPVNEYNYLVSMKVTLYGVDVVDCDESVVDAKRELKSNSIIRGKCARGLEFLKLEWARYELARQWLENCFACDGWGLIIDTRDIIFQAHPFKTLPDPSSSPIDLYFIEEISPYTSPISDPIRSFILWNPRNRGHVAPCYGENSVKSYGERPVLNSGTILGTRQGLRRFLDVLVGEFLANKQKTHNKCQSVSDQWTMNWLYYNGRFGAYSKTATIPWGFGPIMTAGKACITADRKVGADDILTRRDEKGRFLNHHDGQVAAGIHQYDRCGEWMEKYINTLKYHIDG